MERCRRAPKLVFLRRSPLNKVQGNKVQGNKVQGNKVQLSSLSRYSPYYHIKCKPLRGYSLPFHVQVVHHVSSTKTKKSLSTLVNRDCSEFNASLAMERVRRAPPLVNLACRQTRPTFYVVHHVSSTKTKKTL